MNTKKKKEQNPPLARNRKARFDYEILETLEAGIVLTGPEVKSIRNGGISIAESYVKPFQDGIYLLGSMVQPYSHGTGVGEYDPVRPRKLLLNQQEILKLTKKVTTKGLTIVALSVYLKRGYVKVLIALARGKAKEDKREAIKERDIKRSLARRSS